METKEYFEKEMFFENLPVNGLYTPFGSPVSGGQKPSLSLRKAPPLTPALSPQERGRKPPSSARNRCAIRLSDHQRSTPYCAGWDRLGTAVYNL